MIKEKSFDDLILNPYILDSGIIYTKYCLISKITTKLDSAGRCFLQINFRGKDGTPIVGRMFGDTVEDYLKEIEKYINSVVFAEFYVDTVYGQKSLNVNWMKIPTGEDFKGIKIDLFESIIPNIDYYVSGIKNMFNDYTSVFSPAGINIMKQSVFSSLYYKSDESLCSGQCGYGYVIIHNCWSRFIEYNKLGAITKNEIALMFIAQLIADSVIFACDEYSPEYSYIVYVQIAQVMSQLSKFGTEEERKALRSVLLGYAGLRIGTPSDKVESKLAVIMYNEYKAIHDNLKYLTNLKLYKGTMLFNGKVIR